MRMPVTRRPRHRAFTLVELLVVITVIVVLAGLILMVSNKAIIGAEKARCANYIRQVETSLARYQFEHMRPPLPEVKDDWDTIMGDPDGYYSNAPLVAVLTGGDPVWDEVDGNRFDMSHLNPGREMYLDPRVVTHTNEGLKEDGKLYDPWGRELIFAINSRLRSKESAAGYRDKVLQTWGLAEYAETKPRYEDYAIWSYGKDGVMGRGPSRTFGGSDDVKSW